VCTLILGYRFRPGEGLLVAANRDEFYDRPASPPLLWREGPIRVLAPRDDRAGGTWIGFNAEGVFAAITNRFGAGPAAHTRSRGELVLHALAHASAEAAQSSLMELSPADYNGFHLVVMDAKAAAVIWHDGEKVITRGLSPGVHIFTERSLADAEVPRELMVRGRGLLPEDLTGLTELLSVHQENLADGTCLHGDAVGYGTRSSMIVRLAADWSLRDAFYKEGHPCESGFESISELFRALDGRYLGSRAL